MRRGLGRFLRAKVHGPRRAHRRSAAVAALQDGSVITSEVLLNSRMAGQVGIQCLGYSSQERLESLDEQHSLLKSSSSLHWDDEQKAGLFEVPDGEAAISTVPWQG
jgi:hypothetical protein